jgi:hypothetical protein
MSITEKELKIKRHKLIKKINSGAYTHTHQTSLPEILM